MLKRIKSNRIFGAVTGQSLVSVIVAAGVGAIVLGFMTDIIAQQGMGQKFLSQKLEISDLTSNLISTFTRPDTCTCQFSANAAINPNSAAYATDLKFDSTAAIGTRQISVKKLFAGCKSGALMPPLIAQDDIALVTSSTLIVKNVKLINLEPTLATADEWQGQWEVSFKVGANSALRSVRPIVVSQKFTVDTITDPTAARITACKGTSTGTGTQNYLSKWTAAPGVLQDSSVFEDAGKVGIGTATPNTRLHVSGGNLSLNNVAGANTNIIVNSTGAANLIKFTQAGLARWDIVGSAWNGGTDDFYISRFNDAGAFVDNSFVLLRASGNLGIATLTPGSKFEVKGATSDNTASVLNVTNQGNVANGLGAGSTPGAAVFGGQSPGQNTQLISNNAVQMTITSAGNVGIGTIPAAPAPKLEVAGPIRSGVQILNNPCAVLGSQGYDGVTGAPLYCSNTGFWKPMSGGPTSTTIYNDVTDSVSLGVHKACFVGGYWAVNGGSYCGVNGSFNGVWTTGVTTTGSPTGCRITCID